VLLSHGDIPDSEPRFCIQQRNPSFDKGELAEQMVRDTAAAIGGRKPVRLRYGVRNFNRSIGARLSGEIAQQWGSAGLPDDCILIDLEGSAGQSLGVWNAPGLTLRVEGDANDYVGKGMAGGRVIVFPPRTARYEAHRNIIIGNTCLYGATGGELFAAGMAGERFGVRNSGASAVVEGIGDHGCEYMTGGCVVVLGDTGINFGAGMSGGMAFIYDESGLFAGRVNREMVDIHRIVGADGAPYRAFLRTQIERHAVLTGSARAKALLGRSRRGARTHLAGQAAPHDAGDAGGRPAADLRSRDRLTKNMRRDPFQFLDKPRRDGEKTKPVIRIKDYREIYAHHGVRSRRASRPAAAWPAATLTASGSARSTTTSRTGCADPGRAPVRGRRAVARRPIRCPRCVVASALRTGFARAPVRLRKALVR
jgi:glutamate synthase domain-containing protein 3